MAKHEATIVWKRDTSEGADFMTGRYSRAHTWSFDGGLTVPASSSPAVVRVPLSDPANIDPEEAFVASLSSCHMLTYLHLARLAGFEVESYVDHAEGAMSKNAHGVPWVSHVTLAPEIVYRGDKRPTAEEEAKLHHGAHEQCFISQSVKTEVVVASRRPS